MIFFFFFYKSLQKETLLGARSLVGKIKAVGGGLPYFSVCTTVHACLESFSGTFLGGRSWIRKVECMPIDERNYPKRVGRLCTPPYLAFLAFPLCLCLRLISPQLSERLDILLFVRHFSSRIAFFSPNTMYHTPCNHALPFGPFGTIPFGCAECSPQLLLPPGTSQEISKRA